MTETSGDARAALARAANGHAAAGTRAGAGSTTSLTLLALGGLTYGVEVLRRRADYASTAIDQQRRTGTTSTQAPIPEDEVAKYALLGLAFKAPAVIADGLSVVEDAADSAAGVAYTLASPVINSRLFRPFRNAYDGLAERGEAMVNELAQQGRQGQDLGKELVQDATFDAMNNVVEVVAESDEVRDIIQGQTVSLAQEFLAFIQERLRGADMLIQRITFKIIPGDQRNRVNETPVEIPMPEPSRVLPLRSRERSAQ